jgi:putative zinc finger/helix-turn-helix YgiT family protein
MSGEVHCDVCGKGRYRTKTLERHDAGALLGLDGVTLVRVPALVCDKCGAVILDGAALDRAAEALTLVVVEGDGALRPGEVRFLRNALDMTQEALADRLGVHRTTVARWEIGEVAIGQAESVALRALAAMQVLEQKPKLAREVASKFAKPGTKRALPPYEIEVGAA